MKDKITLPGLIKRLATLAHEAGGICMVVGGALGDLLRDRVPKDIDLEVYGKSYENLVEIYKDYGPKQCGKAFGIIKLSREKCGGLDVDISVPRKDNNIGTGHKDFDVTMDPTMTPKEGAMRRDFTINSLYYNVEEGRIIDHFGGLRDLENGVLRATDPATFMEDPLRAFRAMQLLPRKAKTVDPHTVQLIKAMVEFFPGLSPQRLLIEFLKLFGSDKPSMGLKLMVETGMIKHFKMLKRMIGCGQHPEWHPEGDVWTHALIVADNAAWARDKIDPEWQDAFVFGAFLHDVGKPDTTVFPHLVESGEFPKEREWTAWGHDRAGMGPAEEFMRLLTNNKRLIEQVVTIVGEHMQPFNLHQGGAKVAGWKRLHNKIRLDVIGWMSRCDSCGRLHNQIGDPDLDHEVSTLCWDHYGDMGGPEPVKAILQGRHLVAEGHKPGKSFGPALAKAYEAQIDDPELTEEDLLKVAVSSL